MINYDDNDIDTDATKLRVTCLCSTWEGFQIRKILAALAVQIG